MNYFQCATCHVSKPEKASESAITFLYGIDRTTGEKHCVQCCGDRDARDLRETGRATLYLTLKGGEPAGPLQLRNRGARGGKVTNWPGTLSFPVRHVRVGGHNITGRRYDVWFRWEGRSYHGATYGDMTQICHVRQTREAR